MDELDIMLWLIGVLITAAIVIAVITCGAEAIRNLMYNTSDFVDELKRGCKDWADLFKELTGKDDNDDSRTVE